MHLTQSLHRSVQQNPDGLYSIFGERTLTHAQVLDRVSRLASGLRGLGVESDDRVAVLALNSDTYLQMLLAVPWADAVLVPVNTRWSAKEVSYSLLDAEVEVIFIDDTFLPMLPALQSDSPDLVAIYCGHGVAPAGMANLEGLIAESEPVADAYRHGDALAGIFYTGGTTGFPKGVMLSHRNLMTAAYGASASGHAVFGGRALFVAPLFHLAALWHWNHASLSGTTHVVVPAFDPVKVMSEAANHRVSSMLLVPTMIQILVNHPELPNYDLSSLEQLWYGAASTSPALLERSRKVLPGTRFVQGYGMTEVSAIASLLGDEAHDDDTLRRSCGQAAPHCSIKIVDTDGVEVSRGEVGEIAISGDHVMLGYWNKPEETAEALRGGWMHTGDGGRMDANGYVFIADRIKDMIITGGENVYSTEVEGAIASHPSVAAVAVIGIPDADWGEAVHAVIILNPGAELTIDELRDHCRKQIAGYKCPRSLDFVTEFPISGAGKVLKRDLRAQYV